MLNFLAKSGDRIRVTGVLPYGTSKPGEPDPDPLPIGATGLVTNVVNAWPGDRRRAQLWITWDPPHEKRSLMLVGSDPYVVEQVSPDSPEWAPHDEGTRFGLDDQPTVCPHCQSRTTEDDNPDGSQNHTCLNCGFRFVGDWDDWTEDDDEEDEEED